MDIYTVGIPIAFLIILCFCLWIIIGAKGHWVIKMAVIAASLFFSFALWQSTNNLIGWPTDETMPERFIVHWVLVKEPVRANGHAGAVYFWISEIDQNNKVVKHQKSIFMLTPEKLPGEPRTYKTPYSEEMHKKAQAISQMLRSGKMVAGKQGTNGPEMEGDGDDGEGKGGKGKGKGKSKKGSKNGGFSFSRESPEFMFYELPPPKIPDKVLEE